MIVITSCWPNLITIGPSFIGAIPQDNTSGTEKAENENNLKAKTKNVHAGKESFMIRNAFDSASEC